MAGRFDTLPGGGAAVVLDDVEISILRSSPSSSWS